jgi:hypothetical protein
MVKNPTGNDQVCGPDIYSDKLSLKVKVIKAGKLRWLEHQCRMQEEDFYWKMSFHKVECIRRVGRPAVRWLDSAVDGLKIMGITIVEQ